MNVEFSRAICHPTKRKIVECLTKEALSFTALLGRVNGSCEHGKFGYHLRGLDGFVERDYGTKKYLLTYRGKLLLEAIGEFERVVEKASQPLWIAERLTLGDHAFLLHDGP